MSDKMSDTRAVMPRLEFTHCAIFVDDLLEMEDFYSRVLGYPVTDRGELEYGEADNLPSAELVFLSLDADEHHQVILVSGRPEKIPFNPINHLAFRVRDLGEVRMAWRRIQGENVSEIRPVTHGNAWSLYFRDPEGNRLEIYTPTPWHVAQPFRVAIDLTLPDEEITRETLSKLEVLPTFKSRSARHEQMKVLTNTGDGE
jgi:catechol 2,3-dioxygenase-like lactoylglutathione lyase family enzyme